MRKAEKQNLIKAGGFVTFLILILAFVIVTIGNESSLFASKVHLKAVAKDAQGLRPGSSVQYSGIHIGAVESIEVKNVKEVVVNFTIRADQAKWIKKDSLISINMEGLVGDKYLGILSGSEASPSVVDGDTLYPEKSFELKQWINKGENMTQAAQSILVKLDKILTKIEDDSISSTLDNLNQMSQNLNRLTASLSQDEIKNLISNLSESSDEFKSVSQRVDKVLQRVEKGPGSLYSLINDDELYVKLNSLLGGAEKNRVLKYFIRESIKRDEKK